MAGGEVAKQCFFGVANIPKFPNFAYCEFRGQKGKKLSAENIPTFSLYFMFRINYPPSQLSGHTHFSHSFQKQLSPTIVTHLSDQLSIPPPTPHTQDYYFVHKPAPRQPNAHQVKKKLLKMEKIQEMMKKRFEAYVMLLENEVDQKNKQNRQLERRINVLTEEIKEGEGDMEHIGKYLQKKRKKGKRQGNGGKVEREVWVRTSLQPERLSTSSSFRLSTKLKSSGSLKYWKFKPTK